MDWLEGLGLKVTAFYRWVVVKGMVASVVFVLSMVVAILIPDFLVQKLLVFGFGWLGGLAASYLLREAKR
jgi:hypothetical protein